MADPGRGGPGYIHEYLIRGENTPAYRCTDQIFRVNAPQGPGAGSIFDIQRAAKETVYR